VFDSAVNNLRLSARGSCPDAALTSARPGRPRWKPRGATVNWTIGVGIVR
jgi:hypothetical protein